MAGETVRPAGVLGLATSTHRRAAKQASSALSAKTYRQTDIGLAG